MAKQPSFVVRPVNWQASREKLHAIRRKVFVEEQHVPEELEWDDIDPRCYHVLALAGSGAAIGTGRLTPDGHIGRMAVLKKWRGKGVGSAILRTLMSYARMEGFETVQLHAQTHAVGFYEKHGFRTVGGEFMEAGIPHLRMEIRIEPLPSRPRPRNG